MLTHGNIRLDIDPPKSIDKKDIDGLDAWRATINWKIYPVGIPGLPTMIVDSGRGFWYIWKLRQAHPVDGNGPLTQRIESFGRGVERAYGSCADSVRNIDRIARLPGTINHKTGRRAAIIEHDPTRIYSYEDFVSVDEPKGDNSNDIEQQGNLTRTWTGIEELKAGKLRNMIIEGVDRDNPNKSESNVVYTCAFYMMREGYSDEAVTKVLLDPAYGISRHVLEHRNPEKEAKIWIARARKNVRVRQSAPSPVIDVEILRMDDVQPEPIDWLWPYWLAKSKLHILAGMMGDGKSTLAFKFAATISSGGSWPSGTKAPIGNVLIWSGEDSLPDIIRPRLEKMGANLKFVFGISTVTEDGLKRSFNPATDIDCLEKKVKEIGGISLLIIDPIVVVVGKKDSHKNAEVRDSLLPLINFTMRHNCAALGVTHFSKGTGGKDPRERVTGSLAFAAAARIVMVTIENKDPEKDDEPPRMLMRAKSNIGPVDGGFGYDLEIGPLSYDHPDIEVSTTKWLGAVEGNARTILAEVEERFNKKKASSKEVQAWLTALLLMGRWKKRRCGNWGALRDTSLGKLNTLGAS